ncbi:MAG: hypothetical protein BECKG1743D_GA0114223_105401 [Candidatus Kentron sp. G]|nr:MAG: hypothetical protein BECKG1743F_GA0114225_104622 [Candidatus Kentron sp. G]VFN02399.1 MAG: hypothetical protein BECKG1743E_GA0114224_105031 [Candidatus Kentron sp. G]VFN04041.1 MAG: hypothetical protein BECKG1743D_GA0114223_105401 [Candidatus Kentron sp. G]
MNRPSKTRALERLRKVLEAIPGLEKYSEGDRSSTPEFDKWHRDTKVAIGKIFGEESRHVNEFASISFFSGNISWSRSSNYEIHTKLRRSDLEKASTLLESMIEEVEDYWEDDPAPPQCYGSRYFGGSVPHTGRAN